MSKKKENADCPANPNGIQEELAKLKAELKSTKLALAGSKGAHELLSRNYKKLQDQLTTSQDQLTAILHERNSFCEANQILHQENDGLQTELTSVRQELSKSKSALDEMFENSQRAVKQLNKALCDRMARIEELEDVVAKLQQEVSDLHVRESLAKKPWWRRLF